jgi:hypothetical protein
LIRATFRTPSYTSSTTSPIWRKLVVSAAAHPALLAQKALRVPPVRLVPPVQMAQMV